MTDPPSLPNEPLYPDSLDLPEDLLALMLWLRQQRNASLTEIAAHFSVDEAAARSQLERLMQQRLVTIIPPENEAAAPRYRPRFQRRQRQQPRHEDIWQRLDGLDELDELDDLEAPE